MIQGEDFQSRAGKEGRLVQDLAERVLIGAGFEIDGRNQVLKKVGATVNFVAHDKCGATWHFDVSGSITSKRAGLIRTDTTWKALGRASVLSAHGCDRLVLLTTNLPRPGSVGATALKAASLTYFDAIEMLSPEGKQRLADYGAGVRQVPLPGFRSAESIYPGLTRRSTSLGLRIEVPLVEVSDALPERRSDFDIAVMPYRLKVFIPSKDAEGELIEQTIWDSAAERLIQVLGEFAGGCTGVQSFGAWVDPIGGVMHERIHTIEAYSAERFPDRLLSEVVNVISGGLQQHTVALVLDDLMVLLTPNKD